MGCKCCKCCKTASEEPVPIPVPIHEIRKQISHVHGSERKDEQKNENTLHDENEFTIEDDHGQLTDCERKENKKNEFSFSHDEDEILASEGPVSIHEKRKQSISLVNDSKRKKKQERTSLHDQEGILNEDDHDQLINSLLNQKLKATTDSLEIGEDFVEIKAADPQAFNNSFLQQRQKAIDNRLYRSTIESWRFNSFQQLVEAIKTLSRNKSSVDCYWIIFYWIACNIEYDTVSLFTKNYADQTAEEVFRSKKGVCAGYANIYKYLCDKLNLPCEEVNGYAKGYSFEAQGYKFTETNHAWNAVQIDQYWYLIDSTWGAGHLNERKAFQRELQSYYFLARPNEMIYRHLPANDKYQLLRKPIKMTQFMQMPKLLPLYFEYNLELISPSLQDQVSIMQSKVISSKNSHFIKVHHGTSHAEILLRTPDDVSLSGRLENENKDEIAGGNQVYYNKQKQLWQCNFAPDHDGMFIALIFADKKGMANGGSIGAFKIEAKDIPKPPISYPITWQRFYDLDLVIEAPKDNTAIVWDDNASFAEVRVSAPADVILSCDLECNGSKGENCALAQFEKDKHQWQLLFAPQQTGTHKLNIFAKRQTNTSSATTVVQFELNVTKLKNPISFPTTYAKFGTSKCQIYEPLNGVLKKGAIVPIHCVIPGATDVNVNINSKLMAINGYQDPILKTNLTIDGSEVSIYAKYGQSTAYDGLIKYTTQ